MSVDGSLLLLFTPFESERFFLDINHFLLIRSCVWIENCQFRVLVKRTLKPQRFHCHFSCGSREALEVKKQLAFSSLIPRKQGRIEKADFFFFFFKVLGQTINWTRRSHFYSFCSLKIKQKSLVVIIYHKPDKED